jgi:predicted NACHT family NTPase
MMPTSQVAQVDPGTVLSNIERRSQLLVERGFDHSGNPLIAFSHMTFQEYLTALALIDTALAISEPNASQQLITRYENDPEWWEEVALLYSAQLTGVSQSSFFDRLFSGNSTVRSGEK